MSTGWRFPVVGEFRASRFLDGPTGRRRWPDEVKARIVAESLVPGARVCDPRNFILCTNDCHSGTLVHEGHMNRAVRHAIACGCDPLVAIQMATNNNGTHFGLEREVGSIAPGLRADVILISDLRALPIDRVFARGVMVAEAGRLTAACPHYDWPDDARATVRMGRTKAAEDLVIAAPAGVAKVTVRVIGIVEYQAPTRALTADLAVTDGGVEAQGDIAQIALVQHHRATGQVVNAFVSGFGYTGRMAIGSTVAHDCHRMIVVGTDRDQMALAANRLAEIGAGSPSGATGSNGPWSSCPSRA